MHSRAGPSSELSRCSPYFFCGKGSGRSTSSVIHVSTTVAAPRFDTTYCYVTVAAGASCPTSTTTSSPTKGLIQWSQDNLTSARSVYTYDKA